MNSNEDNKPPSTTASPLSSLKIGIVYSDVKKEYFPTENQYLTEKEAYQDAQMVGSYLQKLKINPLYYSGDPSLPEKLRRDRPHMVINLVDSVKGNEYLSATIPSVLELLEIHYTGSGILGKSLDCHKFLVRKLLQQNGIPTPNYQLFNRATDPLNPFLRFPLISKLNEIHGNVEITEDAVSENEKHLRERLHFLIKTYDQPVLVDEYIAGREVTAILLEGKNKKVYLAEKVYQKPQSKYVFTTFEDQWLLRTGQNFHYQKYQDRLLKEYVRKAFEILDMSDYGKFDIRIDNSGRYFFLDSNHNPAFGPKETDTAIANILDLYGVSFLEILKRLIFNTMSDIEGKKISPTPNYHHT